MVWYSIANRPRSFWISVNCTQHIGNTLDRSVFSLAKLFSFPGLCPRSPRLPSRHDMICTEDLISVTGHGPCPTRSPYSMGLQGCNSTTDIIPWSCSQSQSGASIFYSVEGLGVAVLAANHPNLYIGVNACFFTPLTSRRGIVQRT